MVEFKFVGISILSIKLFILIFWVYLRIKNLKYCFSKKEKKKENNLKYSISYNKYGNKDDNALVTLKIWYYGIGSGDNNSVIGDNSLLLVVEAVIKVIVLAIMLLALCYYV